jgi:Ni,Fe-hydrogenase III small subunit/formate hydrogenlyase subunit 6/NADH:ubiquinone oxidoreductase subunit I
MFRILQKTFRVGMATKDYPQVSARIAEQFRGRPVFDLAAWRDARPAAAACPTGAIKSGDHGIVRSVAIDYGRCIFCGECAAASDDAGVRMSKEFELATMSREELVLTAQFSLHADGTHDALMNSTGGPGSEPIGMRVSAAIQELLGRSLAIREVDAGSCNGCEQEIVALNNPVHDIERFGMHFVASPRHADMLLVTGPVTRNMELALRKTYMATPDPKVVVAVGACGIGGGIFGTNYASLGGVDAVIPVDVYVPGCPPRPEALLHGILLAVGRLRRKDAGRPGAENTAATSVVHRK